MARILVFNARRGSEVADLTVGDLEQSTSTTDPAMALQFTDIEKQLLERYVLLAYCN